MFYPSKFCRKGFVIRSLMFLSLCIIVLAIIVTIILLVAYSKSQWCVEARKSLYMAVTGSEPPIPSDFTGTWRVRWSDGCLKEVEVRDGQPHGRYTFWNEEGTKDEEGFYKNGKMHGKWTAWHYNGKKWRQWHCKDGMEHGLVTEWDPNGILIKKTWKYRGWPVLILASEGMNMPTSFSGTFRWQQKDRSWRQEVDVEEGVFHGRFVAWYDKQTKASEGFFKNGKPHGKISVWYPDGCKNAEIHYKEGVEHGRVTIWGFNEILISETWQYEGKLVTKEEFERLTVQTTNNE